MAETSEIDAWVALARLVPRVLTDVDAYTLPFEFVARPVLALDRNLMLYSSDAANVNAETRVKLRQRPIEDVLARLDWDEQYAGWRTARVIGYEDRFLGVVEITWADWCVAEIPLHRVRYVRNDLAGTTVWERRRGPPTEAQLLAVQEAYLRYCSESGVPAAAQPHDHAEVGDLHRDRDQLEPRPRPNPERHAVL